MCTALWEQMNLISSWILTGCCSALFLVLVVERFTLRDSLPRISNMLENVGASVTACRLRKLSHWTTHTIRVAASGARRDLLRDRVVDQQTARGKKNRRGGRKKARNIKGGKQKTKERAGFVCERVSHRQQQVGCDEPAVISVRTFTVLMRRKKKLKKSVHRCRAGCESPAVAHHTAIMTSERAINSTLFLMTKAIPIANQKVRRTVLTTEFEKLWMIHSVFLKLEANLMIKTRFNT